MTDVIFLDPAFQLPTSAKIIPPSAHRVLSQFCAILFLGHYFLLSHKVFRFFPYPGGITTFLSRSPENTEVTGFDTPHD
ncbi:hypothetical protein CEE35_08785 [Candidatus Aerophobetes bacterium Ae_b3b]|nr:MAG: hypothetical protein CEE35_08785 [Candidatus Aerophobetes bacterium Ae_b3b]